VAVRIGPGIKIGDGALAARNKKAALLARLQGETFLVRLWKGGRLEHFQRKCVRFRARKMRQNNKLERFE
jgi:hypothetical protein